MPHQESCLNVIKQSGETLLMILNDILDFSEIQAGQMVLETIEFDLRERVENAVRLFSPVVCKKNLKVIFDINNDTPTRIAGNTNRLRQIIANLAGNAVKIHVSGSHPRVGQAGHR